MMDRTRLRLPSGYSATRIGRTWSLFDPRGMLLLWSPDATTIEIHAWRDVWRTRHEYRGDLIAFHAASRVAAVPEPSPEAALNALGPGRRRVLAAAAAGMAAGVVIGLAGIGPVRESLAPPTARNRMAASVAFSKPLEAAGEHAGTAAAPVDRATRVYRASRPRPAARYAVSVGTYASRAAAERMKHLVRSKGYIVDVVRRGAASQVVTPWFRTRAQAERVARGFEGIRLPARLVAWRVI